MDNIAIFVAILIGSFTTFLGFLLAIVSRYFQTKGDVDRLRRLIYNEIMGVYASLNHLEAAIHKEMKKEYSNDTDERLVNALLEAFRVILENSLREDWYKNARTDTQTFSRLDKDEIATINAIYELQSTAVADRILDMRTQEVLKMDLKDRIKSLNDYLEPIIQEMEGLIREGLDEHLLLEMSNERDRKYAAWVFHKQEMGQMMSGEREFIDKLMARKKRLKILRR